MKYSFVSYLNLGSEIPGRFSDVALEKDGEDLCTDIVRNEKVSRRVEEDRNILKTIKRKVGYLDWSHLA